MIDFINLLSDDLRLTIFPALRLLAFIFGLTLWEDGSISQ